MFLKRNQKHTSYPQEVRAQSSDFTSAVAADNMWSKSPACCVTVVFTLRDTRESQYKMLSATIMQEYLMF